MDDAQESLSQESNVDEVKPESEDVAAPQAQSDADQSLAKENDPLTIKKRLGMQAKKHQREMRQLQEQLAQLHSRLGDSSQAAPQSQQASSNPQGMSIEEQIQRGVAFALKAKEAEEQKAKEAERMAYVHSQLQHLNDEFDKASERHDDFDDVVRGEGMPFTPAIRDMLLTVDNPADVAYKLGKNKEELSRISKLHPLDQAREINKLSFALMGGKAPASSGSGNQVRPMNAFKANPAVNSQAITDKTPASVIRARMKAGNFK